MQGTDEGFGLSQIEEELRQLNEVLLTLQKEKAPITASLKTLEETWNSKYPAFSKLQTDYNRMKVTSLKTLIFYYSVLLVFQVISWVLWGLITIILVLLAYPAGYVVQYSVLSLLKRRMSKHLPEINRIQQEHATAKSKLQEINIREGEIRGKIASFAEAKLEQEMKERGLFKFIDRKRNTRYGTPDQLKKWRAIDIDMSNNFNGLTPREFEKLIRDLFEKMGYHTQLTPYIGDYGADVTAKKDDDTLVIEVKKWQNAMVGSPEVQKLLCSMFKYKANKAIFVTTSEFTEQAKEIERSAPLELWNSHKLNTMLETYFLDDK